VHWNPGYGCKDKAGGAAGHIDKGADMAKGAVDKLEKV
jgi:hypothetical protein